MENKCQQARNQGAASLLWIKGFPSSHHTPITVVDWWRYKSRKESKAAAGKPTSSSTIATTDRQDTGAEQAPTGGRPHQLLLQVQANKLQQGVTLLTRAEGAEENTRGLDRGNSPAQGKRQLYCWMTRAANRLYNQRLRGSQFKADCCC